MELLPIGGGHPYEQIINKASHATLLTYPLVAANCVKSLF